MNGVTFPPSIIQRVVARRGSEHVFADLDPKRTALVVIDLQNAFMDDAVGHAVCPAARDIVPAVNRLAGAVRESGGAVFWIKNTFDETCLTEWSVMQDISTPAMRAKRAAAMSEGTKGHDLWPALDVRPEDEIVKKYRFSAFLPGASDLAGATAGPRFRYGADHRHGDQCLLRVLGARCDDVQLPRGDGQRRQRRDDPGRT